jgi:transcriptional regulator with XRE-family HTH domain
MTAEISDGEQAPLATVMLAEIGRKIRTERKRRRLSLEDLSDASGVSTGLISTLERGKANPSFSTLVALARALGITLAWLLGDGEQTSPVVRKAERRSAPRGWPQAPSRTEILTPDSDGLMEAMWMDFAPGCPPPAERHRHDGEDFLLVISGQLDVYVGEARYLLDAGDSIRFSGKLPHYYGNDSGTQTTAVLVSVPMPPDSPHGA